MAPLITLTSKCNNSMPLGNLTSTSLLRIDFTIKIFDANFYTPRNTIDTMNGGLINLMILVLP